MKLSLNWLRDYIDPKLSTQVLADRLTMAGLEVEGVHAIGGDTVLEIEITPNRPDCLSIWGLAREIGAITGKHVQYPKVKDAKTASVKGLVSVDNKKDCCRYIATLIRGVRITDAPREMKQRLASLGLHAINNAVDITNFVMMETGQPLHAFDFDKLAGGKVIVRRARATESLVTLDGVERKLDPGILVIADAQKPVAIAGIMGGADTQITAGTKNILLESAHFDLGLVRRACRQLGLRSESSYRFERNVDFKGVLEGANRATDLLLPLTGGKLAGRTQVEVKKAQTLKKITVKVSAIESTLGIKITPSKVKRWLSQLGFRVTANAQALTVGVPPHRYDIAQSWDVIEEIARMIGFDRLPSALPAVSIANITVDNRPRRLKDAIRRVLTAGGVDEIITPSMINTRALARVNTPEMPAVRVFNPLSQDQELMRPVLLPSFLHVAATNFNRGQKDLRFFELGKTYFKEGERETLGILLTGRRSHDWRYSKKEGIDLFDLKGLLERIFEALGVEVGYAGCKMRVFDPSCAAAIVFGGKTAGVLGKIDKSVLDGWDIKNHDVYYAAFYLEGVLASPARSVRYKPVSGFPAIVRDVSLAVKSEVPYKKIEEICRQQGGDILSAVQFIEQYLGDKIQSGCKGLVFSCHYQSDARTLREDEVTAVHERILQALVHETGAIRR